MKNDYAAKERSERAERSLDSEEKMVLTIRGRSGNTLSTTLLTEDGFYEVLLQSRKPVAKELKKKVKEVLKALRIKGRYEVEGHPALESKTSQAEIDKSRARALELEKEAEKLKAQAEVIRQRTLEMKERIEYHKYLEEKFSSLPKGPTRKKLENEALNILYGKKVIPETIIPDRKSYTAAEIGRILKSSYGLKEAPLAQIIGTITSKYNLKTSEYAWKDTVEINNHEVDCWLMDEIIRTEQKRMEEGGKDFACKAIIIFSIAFLIAGLAWIHFGRFMAMLLFIGVSGRILEMVSESGLHGNELMMSFPEYGIWNSEEVKDFKNNFENISLDFSCQSELVSGREFDRIFKMAGIDYEKTTYENNLKRTNFLLNIFYGLNDWESADEMLYDIRKGEFTAAELFKRRNELCSLENNFVKKGKKKYRKTRKDSEFERKEIDGKIYNKYVDHP